MGSALSEHHCHAVGAIDERYQDGSLHDGALRRVHVAHESWVGLHVGRMEKPPGNPVASEGG